jgi:hypothetical protein
MANFQLQDSFEVSYAAFEADADSNSVAPGSGDTVVVASSAVSSLTVVPDAAVDPTKVPAGVSPSTCLQTGLLVGGRTAATGVSVTATFSHADGTSAAPVVTTLVDVVVGPATTGSLSLGTPVTQ